MILGFRVNKSYGTEYFGPILIYHAGEMVIGLKWFDAKDARCQHVCNSNIDRYTYPLVN